MRLGVAILVALIAAGSADAATSYRIKSMIASARLSFDAGDPNNFVKGGVDLQARGLRGNVTLSPSGGKVLTRLRARRIEQVRLGSRPDSTQPYSEDRCTKRKRVSGKGGLLLRRTGGRLKIIWSLPQAVTSFCPGLRSAALRPLVPRMSANTSARVGAKRLVLKLSGRATLKDITVQGHGGTATYQWKATVVLTRL